MMCPVCGGPVDPGRRCAACDEASASGASGFDLELAVERPAASRPPTQMAAGLHQAPAIRVEPALARPLAPPLVPPLVQRPSPLVPTSSQRDDRPSTPLPRGLSLEFEYDTPLVNGATLPIALGFGLVVRVLGLGTLVDLTAGMWMHELGHTVVAWLSGILAIPLPFLTVAPSEDRSVIVIGLVLAAWVALGHRGIRRRSAGLVAGALGLAALQVLLTFVMSPGRANQWIIFAGLGGEVALSAVLMLAFYVRLPWRWDFWRYPVLFVCATAYVNAFVRWVGVVGGSVPMPRGSMVGEDSDGDVERLERTGEFTADALARTNLWLALVCGLVILLVYSRMVLEARRLASEGAR
jgi:hypothetical protein